MCARLPVLLILAWLAPQLHARGEGLWRSAVTASSDLVFFVAHDGGPALWRTDGTAEGTWKIGSAGEAYPRTDFVTVGGTLYFLARSRSGNAELYASDGSRGGLTRVNSFDGVRVWGLAANDKRLFYFTRGGGPAGCVTCVRLWAGDGTPQRTRAIAALLTDDTATLGAAAGRRMLFKLYPPQPFEWKGRTNYDVWTTDGTNGGTVPLLDEVPRKFHQAADLLFYGENEVWRSDGTLAGTFPIAHDARVLGVSASRDVAYFGELTAAGGEYAIWKTNGTLAGTTRIGSVPHAAVAAGSSDGRVVVLTGQHVWAFDGQDRQRLRAMPEAHWELRTFQASGLFYFGFDGQGLIRSDGTAAGTFYLPNLAVTWPLFEIGGRVVFWANDGVHGLEPWVSDGSAAGTRVIANLAADREGTIRGRVTDRDTGERLSGATIDYADDGNNRGSVTTDHEGRYTIEGVREGTRLSAHRSGYLRRTQGVFVGFQESLEGVDFALVLGGRFSGRVTRADGTPVRDAEVVFEERLGGTRHGSARTAANGTYTTQLIDPQVDLGAFAVRQGYSLSIFGGPPCAAGCDAGTPFTPVRAVRGGTREGVDFVVHEYARIKGRVVDAAGGKPLAGAEIQAWLDWSPNSGYQVRTFSRADGTYELELPDGRYWVRASAAGYEQLWYPDISCPDCIAPRGTQIVPEPAQVIEHDFRLNRR